jgi:quercetin dioxygenase-like cupin family protein
VLLSCSAMATLLNINGKLNERIHFFTGGLSVKVISLEDAEKYEPDKGWMRASICLERSVSLEYFVKPPKHSSPLHEHPEEQVCVVVKGEMKVKNGNGEEAVLKPGDAAYFASHEPHAIENALGEQSIGIDIFVPGRSFDFWLKRDKTHR